MIDKTKAIIKKLESDLEYHKDKIVELHYSIDVWMDKLHELEELQKLGNGGEEPKNINPEQER
jgi:hypothetical protein